MWIYEKKLQYPVKITNPSPALAKCIFSTLGGPDGELGAANRYLSQRFTAPSNEIKGILTDVGTEEPVPQRYMKREYLGAVSRLHCDTAPFLFKF